MNQTERDHSCQIIFTDQWLTAGGLSWIQKKQGLNRCYYTETSNIERKTISTISTSVRARWMTLRNFAHGLSNCSETFSLCLLHQMLLWMHCAAVLVMRNNEVTIAAISDHFSFYPPFFFFHRFVAPHCLIFWQIKPAAVSWLENLFSLFAAGRQHLRHGRTWS